MVGKLKSLFLAPCILILTLSLVGCSSEMKTPESSREGAIVRPLEDVMVSDPDFSSIGSEIGTVFINTTINLVCAAVYGEDTDYGMIATDVDMAGGAHKIHSPRLTNLKPGTEYYIRFQGVGADGKFYQSKDYVFATKKTQKVGGMNLALTLNGAKISGVSSIFGGGDLGSTWGGNNAIDGDFSTEWSSNGDGDNAWIEIELKERYHINKVGFFTRTMGGTGQIFSFQIKIDDGQETYGPFDLVDANEIHYFEVNFTAKKLLFEVVESSGGNTGAGEIEIYGSS